jgi:hypothetical protein
VRYSEIARAKKATTAMPTEILESIMAVKRTNRAATIGRLALVFADIVDLLSHRIGCA